jgi:hypothetical protein
MKSNHRLYGFAIFVGAVCLATFILNMINGRFHLGDFQVYYSAAGNLVSGEPVYMVSFYTGSGFYKYSPAALLSFLPYTVVSFKVAAVIHFIIIGAASWYSFVVIRNLIRENIIPTATKHEGLLLSLGFACILIQVTRELYLGNINLILLGLCCLSLQQFIARRNFHGGILLGIAVLAKPYLLILLIPLVLRKKWRALAFLGLTILAGSLLPFIFPGPEAAISLYGEWIKTILMHGAEYPGMTSLDYILRHHFPAWPSQGIMFIGLAAISLVILFIASNIRRENRPDQVYIRGNMNFVYEWFLMIALLPNLISADWVLMLFSAPLILFMIFHIASRRHYQWVPVLLLVLFFFGANSDDLLGRELSGKLLHSGWMGLSNFLLVIMSLIMFRGAPPSGRISA